MKKMLTTSLTVVVAVLIVTRLPRLVTAALLHGTGTVARDQKAWVPVTFEEQR